MGSVVKARCECGFKREMYLGGGMHNFRVHCGFPAWCDACGDMVEVNVLAGGQCPECKGRTVPYDTPPMFKREGQDLVFTWSLKDVMDRNLRLTNGEYLCPQCKQFTLHFERGPCWD
ncbi:MAG TPA: hypothetical protein P5137_10430 [Candidatus Brocadiia bacterium]|nr:hypothetical protein [Candidatus Brocadiia bacterium]